MVAQVLVHATTPMNIVAMGPVLAVLEADDRVELTYLNARSTADVFSPVGVDAAQVVSLGEAQERRWDAMVVTSPWLPEVGHTGPVVYVPHGCADKRESTSGRLFSSQDSMLALSVVCWSTHEARKDFIAHHGRTARPRGVLTGYPRLDVLRGAPDTRLELRERLGLGADEKVVLFAPTWGGDGAMNAWGERLLRALGEVDATVVVKVHDALATTRHWQRNQAYWPGVARRVAAEVPRLVFVDDPDPYPLLCGSDVVVADYGSMAIESQVRGVPLVFLALDDHHAEVVHDRRKLERLQAAGVTVTSPDALVAAVDRALAGPDRHQATARDALAASVADHAVGAARRIADLVLEEAGVLRRRRGRRSVPVREPAAT